MSKHKSEDYKLSAVNYYLNNDVSLDDVSLDDVSKIFNCPKQSKFRMVTNKSNMMCAFLSFFCILQTMQFH